MDLKQQPQANPPSISDSFPRLASFLQRGTTSPSLTSQQERSNNGLQRSQSAQTSRSMIQDSTWAIVPVLNELHSRTWPSRLREARASDSAQKESLVRCRSMREARQRCANCAMSMWQPTRTSSPVAPNERTTALELSFCGVDCRSSFQLSQEAEAALPEGMILSSSTWTIGTDESGDEGDVSIMWTVDDLTGMGV